MKIRFMGLMCHVEQAHTGNNQDIVVLIKQDKHNARLRIPKRHISGNPDDEPGVECEDIDQCKLAFQQLGAGLANRTGLAGVPRLTQHGGTGPLHADVANREVGGNLRAFLTMPAGSYGIEDRFQFLGTLPDGSDKCVPRTVKYDATVPGGTTKITVTGLKNGKTIDLKPTATITITNLEPIPNPDIHFDEYRHLFANPVTIDLIGYTTVACPNGSLDYSYPRCPNEQFQNIGVECSNTDYP